MIELVSIANVEWLFLFFDGSCVSSSGSVWLSSFPGTLPPLPHSRSRAGSVTILETFRVKNNSSNIREEEEEEEEFLECARIWAESACELRRRLFFPEDELEIINQRHVQLLCWIEATRDELYSSVAFVNLTSLNSKMRFRIIDTFKILLIKFIEAHLIPWLYYILIWITILLNFSNLNKFRPVKTTIHKFKLKWVI